jgi:hypothetical protein
VVLFILFTDKDFTDKDFTDKDIAKKDLVGYGVSHMQRGGGRLQEGCSPGTSTPDHQHCASPVPMATLD